MYIYIYTHTHFNQIIGLHDYNFLKGSFGEIEDMRYASFFGWPYIFENKTSNLVYSHFS